MNINETLQQAVQMHQNGHFQEAEKLYKTVLQQDPNNLNALNLLGVLAYQFKQYEPAKQLIQKALTLRPDFPEALNNLGNIYLDQGNLEKAKELLEKALELSPHFLDPVFNLGVIFENEEALDQAEAMYRRCLEINPRYYNAYTNLGVLYLNAKNYDAALEIFNKQMELYPDEGEVKSNIGLLYYRQGDVLEAEKWLLQAVQQSPQNKEAQFNLGTLYQHLKQYPKALEHLNNAVHVDNHYVDAWNGLGILYRNLNEHQNAIQCFENLLKIDPGFFKAIISLSGLYLHENQFEEAEKYCLKALELDPNSFEALNNTATLRREQTRFDEAESYYHKALEIMPENGEIHFNLAFLLLQLKRFEEGWEHYEYRINNDALYQDYEKLGIPYWQREPLDGKRLLIVWEQGLGDLIQFARYFKSLPEKFEVTLTALVRPELVRLFEMNFPSVRMMDAMDTIDSNEFDYFIPILSIPHRLKVHDMLSVDKRQFLSISNSVDSGCKNIPHTHKKIGIVWRTNSPMRNVKMKSVALENLKEIFERDLTFISLQKEVDEPEKGLMKEYGILNQGESFSDFVDTAACIREMDLIITIDTSVAHLAAAMGKETWILLHCVPDWRWGWEDKESYWYESVRLYKQAEHDKWDDVVMQVKNDLEEWSNK